MQSRRASIDRLTSKKHKVSCHYFIDRAGSVVRMVKDNKVAWHAGKSKWKNFVNLNKNSLGVELVNKGHEYGYQNFSSKQITSLIKLCKNLKRKYSIKKEKLIITAFKRRFRQNKVDGIIDQITLDISNKLAKI